MYHNAHVIDHYLKTAEAAIAAMKAEDYALSILAALDECLPEDEAEHTVVCAGA